MGSIDFVERKACPGCEATDLEEVFACRFIDQPIQSIFKRYFPESEQQLFANLENSKYVLSGCRQCELVFQKFILNAEGMKELYTNAVNREKLEEKAGLQYRTYFARELMQILPYFKAPISDVKVFDYGMGECEYLIMAQAFGCQVYGFDLVEPKRDAGNKQDIVFVSYEEIPKQQFDLININQVFEHVPNPLQILKHVKPALKPGGLLKLSVPEGDEIRVRLEKGDWEAKKNSKDSLNAVWPLEHINCFNHNALAKLGENAGLKLVPRPRFSRSGREKTEKPKPVKEFIDKVIGKKKRRGTYLFFKLPE